MYFDVTVGTAYVIFKLSCCMNAKDSQSYSIFVFHGMDALDVLANVITEVDTARVTSYRT